MMFFHVFSLYVLSLLNISILRNQNQSISAAHICALRLNEINWRWDMANQIGAVLEEEICEDDSHFESSDLFLV